MEIGPTNPTERWTETISCWYCYCSIEEPFVLYVSYWRALQKGSNERRRKKGHIQIFLYKEHYWASWKRKKKDADVLHIYTTHMHTYVGRMRHGMCDLSWTLDHQISPNIFSVFQEVSSECDASCNTYVWYWVQKITSMLHIHCKFPMATVLWCPESKYGHQPPILPLATRLGCGGLSNKLKISISSKPTKNRALSLFVWHWLECKQLSNRQQSCGAWKSTCNFIYEYHLTNHISDRDSRLLILYYWVHYFFKVTSRILYTAHYVSKIPTIVDPNQPFLIIEATYTSWKGCWCWKHWCKAFLNNHESSRLHEWMQVLLAQRSRRCHYHRLFHFICLSPYTKVMNISFLILNYAELITEEHFDFVSARLELGCTASNHFTLVIGPKPRINIEW